MGHSVLRRVGHEAVTVARSLGVDNERERRETASRARLSNQAWTVRGNRLGCLQNLGSSRKGADILRALHSFHPAPPNYPSIIDQEQANQLGVAGLHLTILWRRVEPVTPIELCTALQDSPCLPELPSRINNEDTGQLLWRDAVRPPGGRARIGSEHLDIWHAERTMRAPLLIGGDEQ